jgi:hypothetical protein
MRFVLAILWLGLSNSFVTAQPENLPAILRPSSESEAEAQRMEAQVFKVLPYEKYYSSSIWAEDNPIGIRGGGGYFSFKTGLHNIGSSQFYMIRPSRILTRGVSIGMFVNLGDRDLREVDSSSDPERFLASFRPPLYYGDIQTELVRLRGKPLGAFIIDTEPKLMASNTYLFRVISYSEADILGVLKVLKIDDDESVTIAWKKLAEFPRPEALPVRDSELQANVDALILSEAILYLTVTVRLNRLNIHRGTCVVGNLEHFLKALKDKGIRHLGFDLEEAPCRAPIRQ